MNNLETEYGYSQEEWVEQTSQRPGRLWKHTPLVIGTLIKVI